MYLNKLNILIHKDLFGKLFANTCTVFLICNILVVLSKKSLGWLQKRLSKQTNSGDQNIQTYNHSTKSYCNFYTSPCIFIVFENFQICFILHTKIKVFFINVKVT